MDKSRDTCFSLDSDDIQIFHLPKTHYVTLNIGHSMTQTVDGLVLRYDDDTSSTLCPTCGVSRDSSYCCTWLTQQPRLQTVSEQWCPSWVIFVSVYWETAAQNRNTCRQTVTTSALYTTSALWRLQWCHVRLPWSDTVIFSSAFVLVEMTIETVCGGTMVSVKFVVTCHTSRRPGVTPLPPLLQSNTSFWVQLFFWCWV